MRRLGAISRQGFIVEFPRTYRVQAEIELIFPAKLKTGLAQGVIVVLCTRVPLG